MDGCGHFDLRRKVFARLVDTATSRNCVDLGRTPGPSMLAMLDAFLLSVRQLGDKRILTVFLKSMLLTLAIFAALGSALWFGTDALVRHYFEGSETTAAAASAVALLIGLLGGWLLFRAIAVAVIGVFADEVVHAVEAKHYPARFAAARDLSFARSLAMGMRSAVRALLVNLVLVPLYHTFPKWHAV
ncbi:hypothetical protein CA257_22340 [Sphingomonas koreensis]|uniref:Uncharacterized protein n=2 Tax=Sphingomonas koreensis TaxID=93064 RepID=A0AAJ4V945_9SPHN|nr:hypothetical protein CA257_22340 [Sphingomonas koreensis]